MSIQFAARLMAYFVLLGALSLAGAAQSTAHSNPTSTQSPPAPASSTQDSSAQNSSTISSTQNSSTQSSRDQDSSAQKPAPSQTGPPAQTQPTSQQPPADTDTSKGPEVSRQGKVAGTSNDRLFKVLPNFLTLEESSKLPPLTTKEKFRVVALGTFDKVNFAWWGFLSAINQADDSEPAYGQGWRAYAQRYGTTAGDSIVENFMVGAVFPSALHQDPRFYQSSKGGFGHRAWYAASRILVTRSDSGNKQFNFSEVFGAAFAAGISTYSYHPRSTYLSTPTNPHKYISSDRTLLNAASVWGTQLSLDTMTIVVKEFWPDVRRAMSHRHKTVASIPSQ